MLAAFQRTRFFSSIRRNVSSAGIEARQALRLKDGVVEALLYLVRGAIDQNHMDNKSVENVICVLRNLSYRCEEVVNPNYDKQPPNTGAGAGGGGGQTRATAQHSGKFLLLLPVRCFSFAMSRGTERRSLLLFVSLIISCDR